MLPTWGNPVGLGAKRTLTEDFTSISGGIIAGRRAWLARLAPDDVGLGQLVVQTLSPCVETNPDEADQ